MKMLLSKCRLFIIFLTFCYVLDSVFASNIDDVLRELGFNGNRKHDLPLCKSKIAEYTEKTKNNTHPGFSDVTNDRIKHYQQFIEKNLFIYTGLLSEYKKHYDSLNINNSNNQSPVFYN